jgi:hypothetical protein
MVFLTYSVTQKFCMATPANQCKIIIIIISVFGSSALVALGVPKAPNRPPARTLLGSIADFSLHLNPNPLHRLTMVHEP